jgi:hypothetical protein
MASTSSRGSASWRVSYPTDNSRDCLIAVAWSRVTATKALGLEMPAILLGHADDVIE